MKKRDQQPNPAPPGRRVEHFVMVLLASGTTVTITFHDLAIRIGGLLHF